MRRTNIDRIINEQINRFVFEATEQMTSKEDFEERTRKARKRDGGIVNTADSGEVEEFLASPYINTSKVIEDATGLEGTSASSIGAKIAKGERPVTQKLRRTVSNIKKELK